MKVEKDGIVLGANVTLTQMINKFKELGNKHQPFEYLIRTLVPHLETIAGTPTRNVLIFYFHESNTKQTKKL